MSWRWSIEVDIPLSTLPLKLEPVFVGCPLSFVRDPDKDIWGQILVDCPRICTNSICIREIRVNSWTVNWRFARTRNDAPRRSRKPA